MKFVLDPHDSMFTLRSGEQLQTLSLRWIFGYPACILEDGGNSGKPVDTWIDYKTQFVDQTFSQQRSVKNSASLYRDGADSELTSDSFKSGTKIGRIADKDIGYLPFTQVGKVFLCRIPSQDDKDVVAP